MTEISKEDDWILNRKLQICGTILPPSFDTNLKHSYVNSFDMNENGTAVLLSSNGSIYFVNLFPSTSTNELQEKNEITTLIHHIALDPPLLPEELMKIERICINTNGTSILLLSQKWLKVVHIQDENTTSHNTRNTYSVQFADGTNKEIRMDSNSYLQSSKRSVSTSPHKQKEDELDYNHVLEFIKSYLQQESTHGHKQIVSISKQKLLAPVHQIGYFSTICHAAWHPLSSKHVVVLSDAEELLIFNVLQDDLSFPEQRHTLEYPKSSNALEPMNPTTSFCFGSSCSTAVRRDTLSTTAKLWDLFTCFLLRANGAIYAMCPLVPYETHLPATVITNLGIEVDARIAICKRKLSEKSTTLDGLDTDPNTSFTDGTNSTCHEGTSNWLTKRSEKTARNIHLLTTSAHGKMNASRSNSTAFLHLRQQLLELRSQRYWLDEAWQPLSSTAKTIYSCVKPHVSGISHDTWPLGIQGPMDTTPKSPVVSNFRDMNEIRAKSILSMPIPGEQPFLLRAFKSGHVELFLLDKVVRPRWRVKKSISAVAISAQTVLSGLQLECLNLGVSNSNRDCLVLSQDPWDSRFVYVYHESGIHAINVSWVSSLVTSRGSNLSFQSSVSHVFSIPVSDQKQESGFLNTSESTRPYIVGSRIIKNVNFGHLLLVRLSSGAFNVVNLSSATSELIKSIQSSQSAGNRTYENSRVQNKLPETLASLVSSRSSDVTTSTSTTISTQNGMAPFVELLEKALENLSVSGVRVTGSTKLHEVDSAVLQFVLKRIKILHGDVAYVDNMSQLIRDRTAFHKELLGNIANEARVVKNEVELTKKDLKKLQAKLETAKKLQKNLGMRAAAVLQAVRENQPQLSLAEREYFMDLQQMAIEVRRLIPRMAHLSLASQRVQRMERSGNSGIDVSASTMLKLSASKTKMCHDILTAQTQLIQDTKILLEDMKRHLGEIKRIH